MIISGVRLPISLLILFIALTSCGKDTDTAVPYPAETKWVQVGADPTITINRKDGMTLVTDDTASSTITIANMNLPNVIAWKEGDYINLVAYNMMVNGATLIRIIPSEKRVVYATEIYGLGQIDHSQYHNHVDVYLNNDLVMIVGREGAGNYTEIRRIATGSLINVSQEYDAKFPRGYDIKIK